MKVYENFPETKSSDVVTYGLNARYEIATLPEPEREKEYTIPSGEIRTVDEMTIRELQETT